MSDARAKYGARSWALLGDKRERSRGGYGQGPMPVHRARACAAISKLSSGMTRSIDLTECQFLMSFWESSLGGEVVAPTMDGTP